MDWRLSLCLVTMGDLVRVFSFHKHYIGPTWNVRRPCWPARKMYSMPDIAEMSVRDTGAQSKKGGFKDETFDNSIVFGGFPEHFSVWRNRFWSEACG